MQHRDKHQLKSALVHIGTWCYWCYPWCNLQHRDEHQLKSALVHGAMVLHCYGAMVHGAIGAIHGTICNRELHQWKDAMQYEAMPNESHTCQAIQCKESEPKPMQCSPNLMRIVDNYRKGRHGELDEWKSKRKSLSQTQKKILGRRDGWKKGLK